MAKKIVKKNDKSEVKEKLLEAENVPNDDKKRIRKKNRDRARKQENWFLFILIIILLACFAAIGFLFYKYFYAGASSNKYGDRLDGIESYPLPENLESKVTELYASEKSNRLSDKTAAVVKAELTFPCPVRHIATPFL